MRFSYLKPILFFALPIFLSACSSYPLEDKTDKSEVLGKVDGRRITQKMLGTLMENYQSAGLLPAETEHYAWEELVNNAVIKNECYQLGLTVGELEVEDAFIGENISPLVRRQFMDPATGQFNPADVKRQMDFFYDATPDMYPPEQWDQIEAMQQAWTALEKQVQSERLFTKYLDFYKKGIYTPRWMAEAEAQHNQTFDFQLVHIPYESIPDSDAPVSEEEMQTYLNEHPDNYKQKASANIEFVRFPVVPSASDSANYINELKVLADEFTTTTDDSAFVIKNDGVINPNFQTKADFYENTEVADALLAAAEGEVVGPYIHNGEFTISKILAKRTMPDRIRSRHILRQAQDQAQFQQEYELIETLQKDILAGRITFEEAAEEYGQDGTKFKGGDLGYVAKDGSFVASFENYLFSATEKNVPEIVFTEFGIHLVEITDFEFTTKQTAIRTANISKPIIPSAETEKEVLLEANSFLVESQSLTNFRANATKANIKVEKANNIPPRAFEIMGLDRSETVIKIIQWANKAENESVAKEAFGIENSEHFHIKEFVIPALVFRAEEGAGNLDNPTIRASILRTLQTEKKTALVRGQLSGVNSIEEVATRYSDFSGGIPVATSAGSNFPYINGIGVEPMVVAVAAILENGQLSNAIQGDQGIFVIQLSNTSPAPTDAQLNSMQLSAKQIQITNAVLIEALRENANIVDNRSY